MKKKNSQSGIAFVEFAIVLPLLLLITFGIIEFGLLMFNKQVITNASREAARAGIVASAPRLTNNEIISIANNYCGNYLVTFGSPANPTTTPIPLDGTTNFGDRLQVTVQYPYSFLIPSLLGMPNTLNISATTTMRYE